MSEEENKIEAEAHGQASFTASASISYVSGFPKKQLEFAKIARDRAGEIEALYDNKPDRISHNKKVIYQESVVSAVINSIAFLKGQKKRIKIQLSDEELNIPNKNSVKNANLRGGDVENIFDDIIKKSKQTSEDQLNGTKPYTEIKTIRHFRNDLEHFYPFKRPASEKYTAEDHDEEYQFRGFRHNTEEELEKLNFSESPFDGDSSYPFNWLSYEMAERSVRMSFNLWRSFARKLGKEDEFLKGVPRP